MAVYGIGATFKGRKHFQDFKDYKIAFLSWDEEIAPELHKLFQSIKIGDIFYIKSYTPRSGLIIKAVGIVSDNDIKTFNIVTKQITDYDIDDIKNENKVSCMSVKWVWRGSGDAIDENKEFIEFEANMDKYNVRNIAIYEEFNKEILDKVIDKIVKKHL